MIDLATYTSKGDKENSAYFTEYLPKIYERRTESGPSTVDATSVRRSTISTVASRISLSAIASRRSWRWSRSRSPWATATQVARTVASAATDSTSVWRGAPERRSRVQAEMKAGVAPSGSRCRRRRRSRSDPRTRGTGRKLRGHEYE